MPAFGFTKTEAKTQAWALFIKSVTGKYPKIERKEEYNKIILSDSQVRDLQKYFTEAMSTGPTDVRINLNPVLAPVILKKYLPWFIIVPLGLITIGGLLKRK